MSSPVRQLQERLAQATSAAECVAALIELAHLHAAEFRERDALRYTREALNIARARNDRPALGRALAAATRCHYQRGDYESVVATAIDSMDTHAEGDLAGRSAALQNVALALFAVSAHERAATTAKRALADASASRDKSCEAGARTVLGLILADEREFSAARRELRQAATAYRHLDDGIHLKKVTRSLGDTYRRQGRAAASWGQNAQARFYWKQAMRVYRIALSTGAGTADDALILVRMSECELQLGDPNAAHASVARAVGLDIPSAFVQTLCHLGESAVLQALGDLKAAERAAERACRAAEHLENGEMRVRCLTTRSKLADQLGRFETAADLETRARDIGAERTAMLDRVGLQLVPVCERYRTPEPLPEQGKRNAA